MINNILYIANFQQETQAAASIIYCLLHQELSTNIIGLFNNSIIKDIYYNYFINHTDKLKLYDTDKIQMVCKDHINKYQYFVILSNTCLYNQKYHEELTKICRNINDTTIVYPQNSEQIKDKTIIVNKQKIIEYLPGDFSIQDLQNLYLTNNQIAKVASFQSVSMDYTVNHNNTLYVDDYCIFGKFTNNNNYGLLDSMAYINKNNNRVYNIVNNIIGYVTQQSDDTITIEWQTDNIQNPIVTVKYYADPTTKCYIAI